MGADNVSNFDDWQYRSLSQLAQLFGLSRDTVKRRIEEGRVRPGGKTRNHDVYHIGDVAQAIYQPLGRYGGSIDPDKMEPRDRKDWYQGESERLKIQKEMQILVTAEDVRATMAEIIKPAILLLEGLPDILERDYSLSAEAIVNIEKRIDSLREQWAEKLETL